VDVWEYGYELWLDSLTLPVVPVSLSPEPEEKDVQLTVYPNPASDFWIVEGDFSGPLRFEVYDINGQRLMVNGERMGFQREVETSGNVETSGSWLLRITELPEGVYLLKVVGQDWTKTVKVSTGG
jgi:hypothetical protein